MPGAGPEAGERLPWLEPYREANVAGRPLQRRGYKTPVAVGAAIGLLLAVGGTGYWLGQRGDQAPIRPPSATVAMPPARPAPAPVEVATAPPQPAEPEAEEVAPAPSTQADKPKPAKPVAKRKPPPRKTIRSASAQRSKLNTVRARQERQAASRPWPKMPSPGPAGQVIQLGAFSTAARANNAYSARVARYPILATMPRVVVPIITKPDGRVLYALRLGTTSRQQSRIVCRNLRASGDHCLVIG
ncbi:MAG TPA: hypothetical protein VM326_03485 [Sphingomicrobium sp.]|jgi:hypothetical protein|nr:hypothetical protein [Sphingomicrobium sp.]